MSKSKGSSVFEEASKLRDKHPRKYKQWQQYVSWATRLRKGGGKKKKVAGTSTRPKKAAKPPAIGTHTGHQKIGSVAFHKSQARKQLEEKLAWMLLARDQEKRKTYRTRLSKKVALLRQELHGLK